MSELLFPSSQDSEPHIDFPGYIYRLLPVYGRLYVSTNYFCFKSTGALASRTRVRAILHILHAYPIDSIY